MTTTVPLVRRVIYNLKRRYPTTLEFYTKTSSFNRVTMQKTTSPVLQATVKAVKLSGREVLEVLRRISGIQATLDSDVTGYLVDSLDVAEVRNDMYMADGTERYEVTRVIDFNGAFMVIGKGTKGQALPRVISRSITDSLALVDALATGQSIQYTRTPSSAIEFSGDTSTKEIVTIMAEDSHLNTLQLNTPITNAVEGIVGYAETFLFRECNRFNLSVGLPTVTSAVLTFTRTIKAAADLSLYKVIQAWEFNDVCWNYWDTSVGAPGLWDTPGGDFDLTPVSIVTINGSENTIVFNDASLVMLVNDAITNEAGDFSFIIKSDNESTENFNKWQSSLGVTPPTLVLGFD